MLLMISYLELPTPQHIPLYPDTPQKRCTVLRGKRFVEKILDTGKKYLNLTDFFIKMIALQQI
jgi:hypothetical protein